MRRPRSGLVALVLLIAVLALLAGAERRGTTRGPVAALPGASASMVARVVTASAPAEVSSALLAGVPSAHLAELLAEVAATPTSRAGRSPRTLYRGRVVDLRRRGVHPSVVWDDREPIAVTDGEGRWTAWLDPRGRHRFHAAAPGLALARPTEAGFQGCGSMLGLVERQGIDWPTEVEVADVVLASTGRVVALVVDEAGAPLVGMGVHVGHAGVCVGTDPDGLARLDAIAEGEHRVEAHGQGFGLSARIFVDVGRTTEVRLVARRGCSLRLRLDLRAAAHLERVRPLLGARAEHDWDSRFDREEQDGAPLLLVRLTEWDDWNRYLLDAEELTLRGFDPGRAYEVMVRLPGLTGRAGFTAAQGEVERRLELAPAPRVRGTLRGPTGLPLADERLLAHDPASGLWASCTTGPDGGFAFDDLPEGRYDLLLRASEYGSIPEGDEAVVARGVVFCGATGPLDVTAPPRRTVNVLAVSAETGAPLELRAIEHSTCEAPDPYDFDWGSTTSGYLGSSVPLGPIWVSLDAPGHKVVRRVVVEAGDAPIRVEVPRTADLVVHLRTPDGVEVGPFSGAKLRVEPLDGPTTFDLGLVAEDDGAHRLVEAAAGRYRVEAVERTLELLAHRAGLPGLRLAPLEVSLAPGERRELEVTLEVDAPPR